MQNRCAAGLIALWCFAALIPLAVAQTDVPDDHDVQVGLSASLFAIKDAGQVNNVSLMWASAAPSDHFEIQRAAKEAGPFETIYTGAGHSFKDYALAEGPHFYRLLAQQNGAQVTSHVASVTTMPMPAGLQKFSNEFANQNELPETALKAGNTFYMFRGEREGKSVKLRMRTSTDGKKWKDGGIVMDTRSNPELADCKFEAEDSFYDSIHDRIVFWCHWEKADGYGSGKALVATAKPGERFTIHHIYNPLGIEVRDMSLFVDDNHQGYLVAAANHPGQGANATLHIFKLNETYDDAVEVAAKVMENGYREAPHIVKHDGFYYLFFSQAAGWFPSEGGYLSTKSLSGPWSSPRTIGSPSTFSSQSGGILEFGAAEPFLPVMMGNRWVRGDGTSRQVALPVHFADGFAFYDFSPVLLHDQARNLLIPVDAGKLLSQDKPARSSIAGKAGSEAAKAFDGDYFSSFESDNKSWPFEVGTDLGSPCTIRNVQISWFIHKGSEAFYTYAIEGSVDGKTWKPLMERTNSADRVLSKTYGFTSDELSQVGRARYVKVKVNRAYLHNNSDNWYSPTIYEIKIFGDSAS